MAVIFTVQVRVGFHFTTGYHSLWVHEGVFHQGLHLWKRCKHPEPCIFRPWFPKFLFNCTFSSHAGVWWALPDGPHKCFVVLHSLFACQASLGLHTSPISILYSFERNGSATFYTFFFDKICMMWCSSLIKIKDVIVEYFSHLLLPDMFPYTAPCDLNFGGNIFGLTSLKRGETPLVCLPAYTVGIYHVSSLQVAVFLLVHSHFSDSRSWDLFIDLWIWHCHPFSFFFSQKSPY